MGQKQCKVFGNADSGTLKGKVHDKRCDYCFSSHGIQVLKTTSQLHSPLQLIQIKNFELFDVQSY